MGRDESVRLDGTGAVGGYLSTVSIGRCCVRVNVGWTHGQGI